MMLSFSCSCHSCDFRRFLRPTHQSPTSLFSFLVVVFVDGDVTRKPLPSFDSPVQASARRPGQAGGGPRESTDGEHAFSRISLALLGSAKGRVGNTLCLAVPLLCPCCVLAVSLLCTYRRNLPSAARELGPNCGSQLDFPARFRQLELSNNMNSKIGDPSDKERPLPKPPTYSFITINDPKETKSRSKKRQVRSAVAYYQHHKHDGEDAEWGGRRRGLKRTSQSPATALPLERTDSEGTRSTQPTPSPLEEIPDFISEFYPSYQPDVTLHGTRVDPYQSYPIDWKPDYGPILDFYITHVLIDTPAISQPGTVFLLRSLWLPFMMTKSTIFYAALAFAGATFHSQRKRPLDAPILLELRHRAISSINGTLSDPESCKTDQMIAAVFCLSLLESMHGDAASYQIHMGGLAKMVGLRGGLENIGLDGLIKRMVLWLDYNHAKVHGSALVFNESDVVELRPSPFKHLKDAAPSSRSGIHRNQKSESRIPVEFG
ncbi:unnamed protein product [Diplocarpon coronariae]